MSDLRLAALWRYPVKSMGGEPISQAEVFAAGIKGDRAYALVDGKNRVGSAKLVKRFGNLLHWEARFKPGFGTDAKPPVVLSHADGRRIASDARHAAAGISEAFGDDAVLCDTAPAGVVLEFPKGTVGGQHAESTELPLAGAAPAGGLVDVAPLLLIAQASILALADGSPVDWCTARLRPNLIIAGAAVQPFGENAWVGNRLAIGAEVVLRVIMPCPRCVMTTLSRPKVPADPHFLRRVARANTCDLGEYGRLPCAGAYATVETPGRICEGDTIRILDGTG